MITSVAIVIQPLLLFLFSQLPHTLTDGNAPLQSDVLYVMGPCVCYLYITPHSLF